MLQQHDKELFLRPYVGIPGEHHIQICRLYADNAFLPQKNLYIYQYYRMPHNMEVP